MEKVFVAEIGNVTTVVNAFGDLRTEQARLLGQGRAATLTAEDVRTALEAALKDLQAQMGPVEPLGEIPLYATSSIAPVISDQGRGTLEKLIKGKIWPAQEAVMTVAKLVYEEAGAVVVLDMGGGATAVHSVLPGSAPSQGDGVSVLRHGMRKPPASAEQTIARDLGIYANAKRLAELAGEGRIQLRYGDSWQELLQPIPSTAESVALSQELIAVALREAYLRHCGRLRLADSAMSQSPAEAEDFGHVRWVIGTGRALAELPSGLQVLQEALTQPDKSPTHGDRGLRLGEKTAFFLDRHGVMTSLGPLVANYRRGAWQILVESLGIET